MKLFIKPKTTVLFESVKNLGSYISKLNRRYVLITDDQLKQSFGNSLEKQLNQKGFDITLISFPCSEKYKTRETKEKIEDTMLSHRFGSDSAILALGGGIVTDLAGFIAATYCRGIPLISIPTNLMGMVDASVGGKTGVNTPQGKNMIGTLYPASFVLIDQHFLTTLPEHQWKNGYAEVIKYGLIASKPLFLILEKEGDLDMEKIIHRCIVIKKKTIESDLRNSGKRHILNFGHTIGHALENLVNYQISHGEAVATGILVESFLSLKLGGLTQLEFDRIQALLKKYKFSLTLPKGISFDALLHAMSMDKKSVHGSPRFVVLNSIGNTSSSEGAYCRTLDPQLIQEAYEKFAY